MNLTAVSARQSDGRPGGPLTHRRACCFLLVMNTRQPGRSTTQAAAPGWMPETNFN